MNAAELVQANHTLYPQAVAPTDALGEEAAHDLVHAASSFLAYLSGYKQASRLTEQAYCRDLTRLHHFLKANRMPTDVGQIDVRAVQAFAVSLSGLASATITRALSAVSSLFGCLVRSGVVSSNPVDGVVKPKRSQRLPDVPDVEQCRQLVAACCNRRERAMVMLLVTTGLRRSELLSLRAADVAGDISHVRITGKGGQQRVVPLPGQTRQALQAYRDVKKDAGTFLFPNRLGRRLGNTSFYRMFGRISRRAGLAESKITPHSLRHAYATTLLHSAVDIKTVQQLLGHHDLTTTSRYLHTTAETKRAAAEALPDYLLDYEQEVRQ